MPGDDKPRRVCLGQIAGAHGVKGDVKIRTFTEVPTDVGAYGPLEDESGARRFTILTVRANKGGAVARLEGVGSREAAQALKGTELWIDRDTLPDDPDDDSYYHVDLIGLVAINADGAALGQVVAVQNFGAGDLLELRPATGGKTVLVPFTEEIVPELEIEAGWMIMLPPEGLFDE